MPFNDADNWKDHPAERRVGDARIDHETTHAFGEYDFEVDTTLDLAENVASLAAAWKTRQLPGAFERMLVRARQDGARQPFAGLR